MCARVVRGTLHGGKACDRECAASLPPRHVCPAWPHTPFAFGALAAAHDRREFKEVHTMQLLRPGALNFWPTATETLRMFTHIHRCSFAEVQVGRNVSFKRPKCRDGAPRWSPIGAAGLDTPRGLPLVSNSGSEGHRVARCIVRSDSPRIASEGERRRLAEVGPRLPRRSKSPRGRPVSGHVYRPSPIYSMARGGARHNGVMHLRHL